MTEQAQSIPKLRRRFPHEWLLVEVTRFDPKTTTPLTGRLKAHAPSRDALEKLAARAKGLVYLVHGTDIFPRGNAAAFDAWTADLAKQRGFDTLTEQDVLAIVQERRAA